MSNSNSYLVTYDWKGLQTIQIITLVTDAYDTTVWPKRRPVKLDQLPNIDWLTFWTELTYTPANCNIDFLIPNHFKKCSTEKGLKITIMLKPLWGQLKLGYR